MICKPIDYCRWDKTSAMIQGKTTPENRLVAAVFKNWSHDRARWANLTVKFEANDRVVPLDLRCIPAPHGDKSTNTKK
jgi:hypothetical protein